MESDAAAALDASAIDKCLRKVEAVDIEAGRAVHTWAFVGATRQPKEAPAANAAITDPPCLDRQFACEMDAVCGRSLERYRAT